ncbi:MAG: aminotransferase class III-fold pyridoxal phosphate-dependent enzyme [Pirellulales bacterium]
MRTRTPNLFRLYLNPGVTQACYCLTHLVESAWPATDAAETYQVFLANSGDEAASGAIKLARYSANLAGGSIKGLIVDADKRFQEFAYSELPDEGRITFIPGLEVTSEVDVDWSSITADEYGFVLVSLETLRRAPDAVRQLAGCAAPRRERPLLIVVMERKDLAGVQANSAADPGELAPDIVVFDESFVDHGVPFGAFAASRRLYSLWNRRGMATFHSTTYQPNTISSRHFLHCLRRLAPDFWRSHERVLQRIEHDLEFRERLFRDAYSPNLAMLTSATGIDQKSLRAEGHYVTAGGRRIFDAVAGVACSIRGHNPENYVSELNETGDFDSCREEVSDRLHAFTGLPHAIPAVSGASAVETALRLALVSQYPRDYVLALQGGFGGKTLFALTGTWKESLKRGITPLYPNVVYVNPFAEDAIAQVAAAFERYPIGVVQMELVQGVGGVRPIPQPVVEFIAEQRERHDCLLFADEVQTGMFRTGPFVRSADIGLHPDVMTIGKGTSDMMFPFAMSLHSDQVQQRLDDRDCTLPRKLLEQYGYEVGYRTLLNVLRLAEEQGIERRVRAVGQLIEKTLREQLQDCAIVSDARCFGLLIGIELRRSRFGRSIDRVASRLALFDMLHHAKFPLLAGFCQYEASVLKLTPPLSITDDEARKTCATIAAVMRQSTARLAMQGVRHALRNTVTASLPNFLTRSQKHESIED